MYFKMDMNIVSVIYLQNCDSSFYFKEEYIFLVKHSDIGSMIHLTGQTILIKKAASLFF